MRESIDVDLAVRNPAHVCVPLEILDLVQIQRAGDQSLQRARAPAADQVENTGRRVSAQLRREKCPDLTARHERAREILVVRHPDLFERMGERVMPHIVEQRRGAHDRACIGVERRALALFEQGQGAAGEMVGTECVLEPGMRGAGVDEIRQSELADVPEALYHAGIDQPHRGVVHPDVVPQRVADDLEVHGVGSPVAARQVPSDRHPRVETPTPPARATGGGLRAGRDRAGVGRRFGGR